MPCSNGIGSCSYNVCRILENCTTKGQELLLNGEETDLCQCPIVSGNYTVDTQFAVPEKVLVSGRYKVKVMVQDRTKQNAWLLKVGRFRSVGKNNAE